MKQTTLFFFLTLTLSYSCSNKSSSNATSEQKTDSTTEMKNKVMIPSSSCYMGAMGKDTFQLKVEVFENVVTGNLSYLFSEKDKQTGSFEGTFKGDTLLADYTFMSEGQSSSRQIAFLINESSAVEGYGDIEEKEGKMVFKNTRELQFGKGLNLNKVICTD